MSKSILVLAALVSVGVYKFVSHQATQSASISQPAEQRSGASGGALDQASAIGGGNSAARALAQPMKQLALAMPSVRNTDTQTEATRSDLRKEIQALKEDINLRHRSLAAKKQDLERSRVVGGDRNPASSTATADIATRNEELRALSNNLNEMRVSGENIRQQEDHAIRVRENVTKLAVSKLDSSLRRMEQWTAYTQAQLERWLQQHVLSNGNQNHNIELENTLAQQRRHIETLHLQRSDVTDDHHRRADNIYNLGQQAREDLRTKEQNVRGQMFSLQSEIRGIEKGQNEEQSGRLNETSRVQQAQRDLQVEAQTVKALETSLLAKEAQLSGLD